VEPRRERIWILIFHLRNIAFFLTVHIRVGLMNVQYIVQQDIPCIIPIRTLFYVNA